MNHTFNDDGIMFEYTCSRHHPKRFSFTTVALRDQRWRGSTRAHARRVCSNMSSSIPGIATA